MDFAIVGLGVGALAIVIGLGARQLGPVLWPIRHDQPLTPAALAHRVAVQRFTLAGGLVLAVTGGALVLLTMIAIGLGLPDRTGAIVVMIGITLGVFASIAWGVTYARRYHPRPLPPSPLQKGALRPPAGFAPPRATAPTSRATAGTAAPAGAATIAASKAGLDASAGTGPDDPGDVVAVSAPARDQTGDDTAVATAPDAFDTGQTASAGQPASDGASSAARAIDTLDRGGFDRVDGEPVTASTVAIDPVASDGVEDGPATADGVAGIDYPLDHAGAEHPHPRAGSSAAPDHAAGASSLADGPVPVATNTSQPAPIAGDDIPASAATAPTSQRT